MVLRAWCLLPECPFAMEIMRLLLVTFKVTFIIFACDKMLMITGFILHGNKIERGGFITSNKKTKNNIGTGKSLSEALIFASTNPQYDDGLFIELQVQYMKIPSSNLGTTCCVQKMFCRYSELTIFMNNEQSVVILWVS